MDTSSVASSASRTSFGSQSASRDVVQSLSVRSNYGTINQIRQNSGSRPKRRVSESSIVPCAKRTRVGMFLFAMKWNVSFAL